MIGYPWSSADGTRPVWLTAAVCYDATDLGLAADLRDVSDVVAIPALNKDVKTFDQMALALHYHMFQLVVVANNGQYGGSNAYWPRAMLTAGRSSTPTDSRRLRSRSSKSTTSARFWSATTYREPTQKNGSIPPQV